MAPRCVVCGNSQRIMKLCLRCSQAFYCSRECQVSDWPNHKCHCSKTSRKTVCENPDKQPHSQGQSLQPATDCIPQSNSDTPTINKLIAITVKVNRNSQKLQIPDNISPDQILSFISGQCSIPIQKLKLIHRGKKVTEENIKSFLKEKAVFLAIGEVAESEEGLNGGDIDLIMKQVSVDRNCAVKALRATSGDVVDAILHISNK